MGPARGGQPVAASVSPSLVIGFGSYGPDQRRATSPRREPLDLPISKELGEWSKEEFKAATIVQSGVYRLLKDDGKWVAYGRGYADKELPWGRIDRAWRAGKRELTALSRRKRFIGLGATLQSEDWSLWRRFVPLPRDVQLAAVGKRIDLHPPPTWTLTDNPATRPHPTEPYDPVTLEGYDPESTHWRPKWEDPEASTVEDWGLTAEGFIPIPVKVR